MATLYWVASAEKLQAELAYSGRIFVGSIVKMSDTNEWAFEVEAVFIGEIAEGDGQAESKEDAKLAVERAWSIWCGAAGLTQAVDATSGRS